MLRCALMLAVAASVAGCRDSSGSGTDRPDVLIVTLDTTRADHLGCYGYPQPTSPNLDRVFAGGLRFDRAWTPVPLTLPAHASLLTALLPPEHGIHDNGGAGLGSGVPVLTEEFRRREYATGAFVSASVLDAVFGLARGFDVYDDDTTSRRRTQRRAGETVDAALAWLAALGPRPAFTWVHLYDPHADYDPPAEFRARFAQPYDAEIAYMDEHVGRLVAAVRARRPDVIVVVLADHGEGLGDHGEDGHGTLIHASTMRIPMAIAWPGHVAAGATDEPVQVVDVAPTILGLLDWPGLGSSPGRDLSAFLRGGAVQPARGGAVQPALIYGESEYAARNFGWAAFHSIGERERRLLRGVELELYDPRTDLEERKDLAAALPEEAAALSAGLDSWLATFVPHEVGLAPGDPRLAERMNALGYASSSPKPPSNGAPRVDPKTRIGTVNAYTRALVLTQAGRGAEAVPLLEQVIREEPDAAAFHFQLGLAQQSAGRPAEAESAFRAAIARDPGFGLAHHHLGALLERTGRLEDALAAFRAAVATEPRAWSHRERVARVLVRSDRRDEALQEMRELIRLAPDRSAYRIDTYRLLRESGRSAEGAQLVLDGLAANPTDHDLALLAAWILATDRDARVRSGTRAVELAERVVAARGRGDTDRLDTLAAAYAEAGRFDDALRTIDEALQSATAELAPEFRARRALYAAGRAFHEP